MLYVLLPDFRNLSSDSILELIIAWRSLCAKCLFTVGLKCAFFSFSDAAIEIFLWFGEIPKVVLEGSNEDLIALIHSTPALFLAHVVPSIFNIGNCTFIDGSHVGIHHRAIEGTIEFLILEGLSLNR